MKVLFVCVGNSCRSQMAEGWAKHLGIEASSAGCHPSAFGVARNSVEAMAEVDIDISDHRPKPVFLFFEQEFDHIFSMGDDVQCPREIKVEGDWGLPDPIGLDIDKYREIRDQIEQKVRALL